MQCPSCGDRRSRVVYTRPVTYRAGGRDQVIRLRRRECLGCGARYTTREIRAPDRDAA